MIASLLHYTNRPTWIIRFTDFLTVLRFLRVFREQKTYDRLGVSQSIASR